MTAINIAAILLSPLIAVLVTLWFQRRKEKRDAKLWTLGTLVSTRHVGPTDEKVRALNMIDITFRDSAEVRRLWHEYFGMLNNVGLNNPLGWQQRQTKNLEMLAAMAKHVGYGKSISHLDIDRVYYPEGLGRQNERAEAISNELLRVLQGSEGVTVSPKPQSQPLLPSGSTSEPKSPQ